LGRGLPGSDVPPPDAAGRGRIGLLTMPDWNHEGRRPPTRLYGYRVET
jgi:hypothetical protein